MSNDYSWALCQQHLHRVLQSLEKGARYFGFFDFAYVKGSPIRCVSLVMPLKVLLFLFRSFCPHPPLPNCPVPPRLFSPSQPIFTLSSSSPPCYEAISSTPRCLSFSVWLNSPHSSCVVTTITKHKVVTPLSATFNSQPAKYTWSMDPCLHPKAFSHVWCAAWIPVCEKKCWAVCQAGGCIDACQAGGCI